MANHSRLESLAVELLHEICGYLLASHDLLSNGPRRITSVPEAFDQSQYNRSGPVNIHPHLPGPALLRLSHTSPHLRSVVDSFSALQLNTWVKATSRPMEVDHKLPPNAHHTARLISWTWRYCVFCGVFENFERDMFTNGLACCDSCHIKRWAHESVCEHIAYEIYGLTMAHLLDYTSRPGNWPVLRFGWFNTDAWGRAEIAFRESEVERLAKAVHGDWEHYVRQRAEQAPTQEEKDDLLGVRRISGDGWSSTFYSTCSCFTDEGDSLPSGDENEED